LIWLIGQWRVSDDEPFRAHHWHALNITALINKTNSILTFLAKAANGCKGSEKKQNKSNKMSLFEFEKKGKFWKTHQCPAAYDT
jgi:hypothetical protein